MDRPSSDGTPAVRGPGASGTPGTATYGPGPSRTAPATNRTGRRWARVLFWLGVAALGTVGVGSRALDTLGAPPAHVEVAPSVLYDRHGTALAEIGPPVSHASLGLEDVAPALVDAVVAALDPLFLEGEGVDASSYIDSLRRLRAADDSGGAGDGIMRRYLGTVHLSDGSVITEAQLLLAELRLGRGLSRPEILERFANVVYLGRGAYGVHAAAAAWYGIPASDLTVAQAAYLASLIDAPWGVDAPSEDAEDPNRTARLRRDQVLVAMFEGGMLTPDELALGRATAVTEHIRPAADVGIAAGSARTAAPDAASGGFIRLLVADAGLATAATHAYLQLVERYGVHRVVTGGLHVTTSIDLPAQRAAFETIHSQLGAAAQAEAVVLDRSGDVRVLLRLNIGADTGEPPVSGLPRGPVGDLGGSDPSTLGSLIGPDPAGGSAEVAGDALEVASAFGVIAAGGAERPSRIVLDATSAPHRTPRDPELDRWRMTPRPVLDADAVARMRAGMDEHSLASGVTAWGRAGVAPQTGDAWFAGWTSHYTAAVRVNLDAPDSAAAATAARELFLAVLEPLQYAPSSSVISPR